ncbi:MAG: type 1 fimbrial protein [Pseudomonadota bacterium]|jgi:major type 1 subunit fimbrin (pilin)|nr:type 1 fimbrial protein [Xanthomonadaceae bacterium]MDE2249468.1 type 1 fimbrial protein [Xanthomonadaceae bacterium]MDE3209666.1 type 1 fimbrial protein [Pseudomonadota bacterium]
MKKTLLSAVMIASFGMAALAPMSARATNGTITFNGAITSKTCTVVLNGGTSGTGTVTLPTVSTSAFGSLGSTAGQTPFTINLSACATGTTTAATYFEAGPTVNTAGRLISSGTATGVDLQLLNSDNSVITAGGAAPTSGVGVATISSGAATLSYFVRYYQNSATLPGAGSVTSTVNYSMIYN